MKGEQRTHQDISQRWVGQPLEVTEGKATVQLEAIAEMKADASGLIHGGFTFGLADYAAMLAVNDPNVVLGGAEIQFLAPVKVGEMMTAYAEVEVGGQGKKRKVNCTVHTDRKVFTGSFTCFVLEEHILGTLDK